MVKLTALQIVRMAAKSGEISWGDDYCSWRKGLICADVRVAIPAILKDNPSWASKKFTLERIKVLIKEEFMPRIIPLHQRYSERDIYAHLVALRKALLHQKKWTDTERLEIKRVLRS